MTSLRSKLLILTLLISSIGFASPPILPISIDSLMSHLGIQGFRTEVVGEKEPFAFEILTVKDGEVTEYTFLNEVLYNNNGPDVKTIEILYSKLNRSQYKFTIIVTGSNSSKLTSDHILDWKGSTGSYGTPILEVGGAPYMFTGDLFSGSFISSEDLKNIASVKNGLMIRVLAKE